MFKKLRRHAHRFRTDIPLATGTHTGSFIFEVRLSDGKVCDAFAYRGPDGFRWFRSGQLQDITERAVGWRETYLCDMARRAVDQWARDPDDPVTRAGLQMALRRHIYFQREKEDRRPACRVCARYLRRSEKG